MSRMAAITRSSMALSGNGFVNTDTSHLSLMLHCERKRNKKGALKPWLRRRTGAPRDLEWVARFANRFHLLEARARTEERTSLTLCAHAPARPYLRPSGPRLALPAPLDGHAWPTMLLLLASCTSRGFGQECIETFLLRFPMNYVRDTVGIRSRNNIRAASLWDASPSKVAPTSA